MDVLINVIGFVVALFALSVTVQHILVTLFQQLPFMRKISKSGVLKFSGKTYALLGVRIIVWTSIVVGIFYVPVTGVSFGALLGTLIGVRAAFDRENKNAMFAEYIKDAERNGFIIDAESWEYFTIIVLGIEKLQKELTKTMRLEKNNMKYFSFTDSQRAEVLRLTGESNRYFYQVIQNNAEVRDKLLLERPEKWEAMVEKNLEITEELTAEMRKRIEERDDILRECKSAEQAQ